jgi:hypothetical protein
MVTLNRCFLMPFMHVDNFCSLLCFGYVLDVVLDYK